MLALGQGKEVIMLLNPKGLELSFKLRKLYARPKRFTRNIQSTTKGKGNWNIGGDLIFMETILVRRGTSVKKLHLKCMMN